MTWSSGKAEGAAPALRLNEDAAGLNETPGRSQDVPTGGGRRLTNHSTRLLAFGSERVTVTQSTSTTKPEGPHMFAPS